MKCSIILFDGFELLDACGPAEVLAGLGEEYELGYHSSTGGVAHSSQKASFATDPFSAIEDGGIVIIPGGRGTRKLASEAEYIAELRGLCERAEFVLAVCTGSALLARTGLLNGRKATSNKKAMKWVQANGTEVDWQQQARWVVDGKYYTSSGISAGLDMSLGFIADRHGERVAKKIAENMEYIWNSDKDADPFAL